ncbi:MAG: hypothetical protein JSU58_07190 [Dehalococcoidales bacterium]|nr:MAG: hypothetical protein JSU58_07190 [Dehalococcoidales bacterium]
MKRILNNRLLIIIGAGLFCIGMISIWVSYLSEVREQKALSEKLSLVEEQTAVISIEEILDKQEVEKDRIANFEEQIAAAQTRIFIPLITSDIFQDILVTANNTDVHITSINSNPLSNETITGINYRTMTVDFSIAGSATKIYDFIDAMSKYFTTGILKTLSVNIQGDNSVATLRLTIYGVKGE